MIPLIPTELTAEHFLVRFVQQGVASADALELEGIDGGKVVGADYEEVGEKLLLLSAVPRTLGGLSVNKLKPAVFGVLKV